MKKTKIVCTIGPGSESTETLTKLLEAGMNVARLNFSHGDHEEHHQCSETPYEADGHTSTITSGHITIR